ncbi:hypothetical protein Q3G72_022147 [Acer saccharum]|nr:hypothetical protein Q3G72_022147 [Acer saccharum]
MEVVVAIIGSAVTEAGRSLCGSFPSIKNFISFQSNLTTLEKDMKSLVDLKRKVIEDVDSFDAQMILWLREVEPIMLGVNLDQLGMTANDQKLSRCFFNCIERYRLCRETARMLKEVERLLKAGDIVAKMGARNYFAKAVEHIPGPSILVSAVFVVQGSTVFALICSVSVSAFVFSCCLRSSVFVLAPFLVFLGLLAFLAGCLSSFLCSFASSVLPLCISDHLPKETAKLLPKLCNGSGGFNPCFSCEGGWPIALEILSKHQELHQISIKFQCPGRGDGKATRSEEQREIWC